LIARSISIATEIREREIHKIGEPGACTELAGRQAELFHHLWDNPGGAVKKETLASICDRD
jgi:hypothetical protein